MIDPKFVTIYVLHDPITGRLVYVGQTVQKPSNRLQRHCTEARNKPTGKLTDKDLWIRDLESRGLRPKLTMCRLIPVAEADRQEDIYIVNARKFLPDLFNRRRGGVHGRITHEDTRARMSAKSRGRKQSAETRTRRSKTMTGVPKSADHRRALRKARLGTTQTKKQGCSSDKLGVCWDKARRLWHACISIDHHTLNLGRFENEQDAAVARQWAAALIPEILASMK